MLHVTSHCRHSSSPRLAGLILVAAAAVLLMGRTALWASSVVKVKTKDATIVLQNVPADAEVLVDGEQITITWAGGQKAEIRVRPGTHKIEVRKNGFTLCGEEVKIEDEKHRVLTACLAPHAAGVERNKRLLKTVLDQIATPSVGVTPDMNRRCDALPPISVETFKKYHVGEPRPNSPLRKAVQNARVILWAIYPREEPKELSREVSQMRSKIRVQLRVLKEGYRAPGDGRAEKEFKDRVENDERKAALLINIIDDSLQELQSQAVLGERERESSRWKANYDFMLARMLLEYAFLFEYQAMLGSMRKELPPRDPALHGGWKLASQPNLQGDSTGKRTYRKAHKLLDKIIKANAGSPWEVLAKREKLTNLGLEWQPSRLR